MLLLRRENGPQLPDHCQDVPELELGHARNEGPAVFTPEPIPVALPRRLEYRCQVLFGAAPSNWPSNRPRTSWARSLTMW